jgi:hypothetical protein
MSAHIFGGEVKRTKRYEMGKRVGNHARSTTSSSRRSGAWGAS